MHRHIHTQLHINIYRHALTYVKTNSFHTIFFTYTFTRMCTLELLTKTPKSTSTTLPQNIYALYTYAHKLTRASHIHKHMHMHAKICVHIWN